MASDHLPIGNSWLKERYGLKHFPLTHISYIGPRLKQEVREGTIVETYPATYSVADLPVEHIEFSLKYDDLSLDFLKQVFAHLKEQEILEYIAAKPRGVYQRRIGYFYELLVGKKLTIDSLGKTNYIDLIDPNRYLTGKIIKVQRWGINDNLLGTSKYCPVIRKTEALIRSLEPNFQSLIESVANQFPTDVFYRAVNYLYTKETRSSYQIEKEEPSPNRMNKFIHILEKAGNESLTDLLNEENLTHLQNQIVDPRFADAGFRNQQNFIGQTMANLKQVYHYICPPPEFVRSMMEGLLETANKSSNQHPIAQATTVAFGFVFIHPFEDGNGRIHRFLIHDLLTRGQLVKKGMIIPVSAHMLNRIHEYDQILEKYSRPLMKRITYIENSDQSVVITNPNEVEGYFRYPDLTDHCIYLAITIKETITEDIFREMDFLVKYDELRSTLQNIVDLPDKKLNLFITLLHQNKGTLAKRRRNDFEKLSDDEIAKMERAFQTIFELPDVSSP